jgi:hypothetical protein
MTVEIEDQAQNQGRRLEPEPELAQASVAVGIPYCNEEKTIAKVISQRRWDRDVFEFQSRISLQNQILCAYSCSDLPSPDSMHDSAILFCELIVSHV